MSVQLDHDDLELATRLEAARGQIGHEVAKLVIGQEEVLEEMLIALLAGGHGLLVGVPGLAKTLLVSALARSLSLGFNRVQFTPDLMPSDITGAEVLEDEGGRKLRAFLKGPVFTNVLLADEINRTPPRTQAALLQAMQERQVTVGGETHAIPDPFLVLATQNPIEQEGTYPLPEAQLDRFMLEIRIGYPSRADEERIVRATTSVIEDEPVAVLGGEEIRAFQRLVRRVPVTDAFVRRAVELVRRSRPGDDGCPVREWVAWGAGPRASQALVLASKARALLRGRVTPADEDLEALAAPVLRHRVVASYAADVEGIDSDAIVRRLL